MVREGLEDRSQLGGRLIDLLLAALAVGDVERGDGQTDNATAIVAQQVLVHFKRQDHAVGPAVVLACRPADLLRLQPPEESELFLLLLGGGVDLPTRRPDQRRVR